jgi:hypothetical protein
MIAHNPLHGAGRADFPHPALALGKNAHAAQRIGMTDGRQRQPASDEAPHTIPKHAAVLTSPGQRALPEPADSEPKNRQRRLTIAPTCKRRRSHPSFVIHHSHHNRCNSGKTSNFPIRTKSIACSELDDAGVPMASAPSNSEPEHSC